MIPGHASDSRRGTVLLVVAGLSGLLASLTLAFLVRVEHEAGANTGYLRMVQARIMLTAACNYIQEASRLGWEVPTYKGRNHVEAYGWIDVRDGQLGPRLRSVLEPSPISDQTIPLTPQDDQGGGARSRFPIGQARRFPMYALHRPPYAIRRAVGNNPVSQDQNSGEYLKTYLRYPDPLPAVDNGWRRDAANPAGTVTDREFNEWTKGAPTPRPETLGLSWFRLMREPSGAVFLVTCGSGGTMGYRTWEEVVKEGQDLTTFATRADFEAMQRDELRLWYRVAWSPHVEAADINILRPHYQILDHYLHTPIDPTMNWAGSDPTTSNTRFTQNLGGTIAWVQRLPNEPPVW